MALSKERQGEIAMIALLDTKRRDGFMLKPLEIKRNIKNGAKKSNIPAKEVAEFNKIILDILYQETNDELNSIINPEPFTI
jgi:hypothetical protein